MRISDWSSDVCSSDLRSLSIGALIDASCRAFVDPANRFLDEKSLIDLTPQHAEARRLKDLAMGRVYRWERTVTEELKGITDRKSVVEGKSVSVSVDLGGRRIIKKQKKITTLT